MPLYTTDSKERVREAADMVEVVSARSDLRRSGSNRYVGLCPFHDERTPSFHVDPLQKVYYCFGCQAAGDLFSFVMETEGVDFPTALELLSDRYGIALETEREDPRAAERRNRRERLYEALGRSSQFYARYLWESEEAAAAREYLSSRSLSKEILNEFAVGYAPSAWARITEASQRAGFKEEELTAAGLSRRARNNGRLYDRFRSRITFPLCDNRGRVIGFGARALQGDDGPKYLNTDDGELYRKGHQLFAAHLARAHAAKEGRVLLAEGYTDVIALHQAGFRNTVGLMGTALTEYQVAELAKLASTVLLALDADQAGQDAIVRAAALAGRRQLELLVVELPQGKDPADLITESGAEEFERRIAQAVPFPRFRVEKLLSENDLSSSSGRDRALEGLRELFSAMPPSALREELVRSVAERLELSEQLAASLVKERAAVSRQGGSDRIGRSSGRQNTTSVSGALLRRDETERSFLALCVALPDLGRKALEQVNVEQHFTSPLLRKAARHLVRRLATPLADLPHNDPEFTKLIAELVVRAGEEPASPQTLQIETLQLEKARLERAIATARSAGQPEVSQLAAERQEVLERIRDTLR